MSPADLTKLSKLLDSLSRHYSKLQDMENEKTKALMSGDIDALNKLMNDEQAVLMECHNTEEARKKLCINSKYKTLGELMESSEEYGCLLGPVFKKLSDTLNSVKKANMLNMRLLEVRKSTTSYLLEHIGISDQETGYKKSVRVKA
ncbi:MAG: flagellar export chaperone FlgN [Oscillospiraceae bacterium]|nr:flagellar export chaperone FlgN [Oscillospiraceae bacterium]